MRVLYGKIITSNNEDCKNAMKSLGKEKNFTYYNKDEGLFIASWGDIDEIIKLLSPYWLCMNVREKNYSGEEAEKLIEEHPGLFIRRPDLI